MAANDKSVFVRNLPYDATDQTLEDHFGDVGPVKSAWIARDRKSKEPRGFGFVMFALPEDAQRAVETMNGSTMHGRKITVDSAKKGADAKASAPPKKANQPTALAGASPQQPSSTAEKPERAAAPGAASTQAASNKAAKAKDAKGSSSGRQFRMIVRNLSFKADEAVLREAFAPHGTVVEVTVPLREGGKHPGFGFVQMRSAAECKAAMVALNESTILNRMVAGKPSQHDPVRSDPITSDPIRSHPIRYHPFDQIR
jgi:RNA recognition motif-containing protein